MKAVVTGASLAVAVTGLIIARVLLSGAEPVQSAAPPPPARRVLRVCADPNNLPYSNDRREGYENRIAEILARDLHTDLEYVWWAQHRGYIRNTIKAGACDLLISAPTAMDMLLVTAPYYRSTYVFVSRAESNLKIGSLDSPLLRKLRVGVQLVGDDYANSPPAHALARRGIIQNVHGYGVTGDYAKPNPPARIIEAVASGDVDVAIAWGPLAGYFARRQKVPLVIEPVSPQIDLPFLPLVWDISMAGRRGEEGFRAEIEASIERNRPEIDRILAEYGIPRLDTEHAPTSTN